MVNKVILVGIVGRAPELKRSAKGQSATFPLATEVEEAKDAAGNDWHRILAWGELAEFCQKQLFKGRLAYIEGRIEITSFVIEESSGCGIWLYQTQVVAEKIKVLPHVVF